ncbi:hypothetical protein EDD16DRAFT_1523966 [Pisolithus croceorrhizus]|nr:hypothetical protein EDD16DRAFT_1523966 [Pisolithus croceorrhizus]
MKPCDIPICSWVRILTGVFRNDIAYVLSVDDSFVKTLIVPRKLPYHPDNTPVDGRSLFDVGLAREYGLEVTVDTNHQGHPVAYCQGEGYYSSFSRIHFCKNRVKVSLLSPDEVAWFAAASIDPSLVNHTMTRFSAQWWQVGDTSRICSGEFTSKLARIVAMDPQSESVTVLVLTDSASDDVGALEISIHDFKLEFPIGASIKVITGVNCGFQGMVISRTNDMFLLQGSDQQLEVLGTFLVMYISPVTYTSQAHYHVQPDPLATENHLQPGDSIHVISGPHKGLSGTLHYHSGHELLVTPLVQSKNTNDLGDKGKSKAQEPGATRGNGNGNEDSHAQATPIIQWENIDDLGDKGKSKAQEPETTRDNSDVDEDSDLVQGTGYNVTIGNCVWVVHGPAVGVEGPVHAVDLVTGHLVVLSEDGPWYDVPISFCMKLQDYCLRDVECQVSCEVWIISGPSKGYRGTLWSVERTTCKVTIHSGIMQLKHTAVVNESGILLSDPLVELGPSMSAYNPWVVNCDDATSQRSNETVQQEADYSHIPWLFNNDFCDYSNWHVCLRVSLSYNCGSLVKQFCVILKGKLAGQIHWVKKCQSKKAPKGVELEDGTKLPFGDVCQVMPVIYTHLISFTHPQHTHVFGRLAPIIIYSLITTAPSVHPRIIQVTRQLGLDIYVNWSYVLANCDAGYGCLSTDPLTMFFSWFSSQEESYPLTSLNSNGDSSKEHNNSPSLMNTTNTDNPWNEHNPSSSSTMPMNIDNPWNDIVSPHLSKLSVETEATLNGHATMANVLGVAEVSAPTVNIRETMAIVSGAATDIHTSTALPKEAAKNKAPENTAVVIRSIGSSLGKHSTSVNTCASTSLQRSTPVNTCASTSLQRSTPVNTCAIFSNLHWQKVVLKELDYSSSLRDNFYNFMREQAQEHDELIKAFEGACITIEKEHSLALAQELHDHDMTIAKQRAMLEELDTNLRMLQMVLEGKFTRLDADRNVKFAHLAEEHERLQQELDSQDRTIAQQRVSLEHLQGQFGMLHTKLDSEITRKFEGAVHQIEVLNWSQRLSHSTQLHVSSTVSADPHPVCRSSPQEEVRRDTVEEPCHAQEHVREVFNNVFSVTGNRDFLSFESPLHEVVMSFAEGSGPGPDPINLQWDFSSPVSSVWNQAVVNILLNKLHELGMEEWWATTPRSDEYWKEAIKQKFNQIKVMWNKGRPQRLENDILETPAEVAARLMQEKNERSQDSTEGYAQGSSKSSCCSC